MFALQASLGNQWSELATLFKSSGKSSNDCKNRYNSALRKVERSLHIGQNEAAALLARYALAIKHKIAGGEAGDDARFEDGLIELAHSHKGPYSQLLPAVKQAAASICKKVISEEKIGHLQTGRRPSLASETTPITASTYASPSTSTPLQFRSLLPSAPLSSSSSSSASPSLSHSASRLSPTRKRSRPLYLSQSPSAIENEVENGYDSDSEMEVLRPAKILKRRVGRPSKESLSLTSSLLRLSAPAPSPTTSFPYRQSMIESSDHVDIGDDEEKAVDALFSFRQWS